MKPTLITLLLLLALAGCFVEPGGGYGHRGYGEHGWGDRDHSESRDHQEQRGNWGR